MNIEQYADMLIQWSINNYWIPISIIATLIAVQLFKVPFKYYFPAMDIMTRRIVIGLFSFFSGYFITSVLTYGDPESQKWAVTIAISNMGIYKFLLIYATKKRWLGLVALLKGRKFVVRNGVEKVVDDDDKTIITGRRYSDASGDK